MKINADIFVKLLVFHLIYTFNIFCRTQNENCN